MAAQNFRDKQEHLDYLEIKKNLEHLKAHNKNLNEIFYKELFLINFTMRLANSGPLSSCTKCPAFLIMV